MVVAMVLLGEGTLLGVGLVEGGSRGTPRTQRNFDKFLKKISKCELIKHIFYKINKSSANVARVWTKNTNSR